MQIELEDGFKNEGVLETKFKTRLINKGYTESWGKLLFPI